MSTPAQLSLIKEIEDLEQYLMECTELSSQILKELNPNKTQEKHVPLKSVLEILQEDCQELLYDYLELESNSHNSAYEEGYRAGFIEGKNKSFKECISLLEDIADDTDEFLPNNKKALELSTAYRKIAEGIQEMMHLD